MEDRRLDTSTVDPFRLPDYIDTIGTKELESGIRRARYQYCMYGMIPALRSNSASARNRTERGIVGCTKNPGAQENVIANAVRLQDNIVL